MTRVVNIAQSGGNNVTMRNRIINGAMMIDQRNAGASVSGDAVYPVDRWRTSVNTGTQTLQRSTVAPTGFVNSVLWTVTASGTPSATSQNRLQQMVEGLNVADLGWGTASPQSVTLSFWVRSSLTGTFSGCLMNSAYNRSYVFTYTINSANTWEQKSITIAGDTTGTWLTDNGVGIRVCLDTGSGSNFNGTAGAWNAGEYYRASGAVSLVSNASATFYITGVQLEAGTTATPFEQRLYGTELALCQRYFEMSYDIGTALGTATTNGVSMCGGSVGSASTSFLEGWGIYKATKRIANPTLAFWDLAGNSGKCSRTLSGSTTTSNQPITAGNSGMSNLGAYSTGTANANLLQFHWTSSAEL